ncbi:hypothetical protein N9P71_01005 [Saprospiraceae bacterium]|nr:hypothetical protein [Saprospiraceae bacterium]
MNLFLYLDLNFSFNFGHYYNIFTNIYSACSNESDLTLVHSDWKHYDDGLSEKFNDFPNLSRVFVNKNNDYIERIIAEVDFESYENIVIYVYKGGVDFIEPLSRLSDHLDLIKSKAEIWNTLFLLPFDQLKLKSNTFKSKFVKEIKFSKSLLNNRPIKLCFDVENSIWNKYFDEVSFLPPPLLKDDKFIDKKPYSGDPINIALDVWHLRHAPKFRNEKIENLKKLISHLCNTFSNILIHIKIADSSFIIDEEKDSFFTSNPQIKIIRFLTQSGYKSFIENTDIYILQYSSTFYKNKSSGHFLELIKHNVFIIGTKNTFLEDNTDSEEYLYDFGDSTSLISVTSAAITNKAYLTNLKPQQKHKRLLHKWSKEYFKNTLITQIKKNKNTKSKIKRTNKPFIVLGNGPSLKGFDFDKLNGHDTIGMNAAYRYWDKINWYPTYYICLDTVVVKSHHEEIKRLVDNSENLGIKKFFVRKILFELQPDLEFNPKVVTYEQMKSENPLAFDCIHVTTGSFAARFAIYEGYKSIIMLGIDETYINFIKESKLKEKITLEITDDPIENPNYFFSDYQQKGDLYQIANHSKVYKCNCKHCEGDIRNGETLHVDAWKFLEDDINTATFISRYGNIRIVNCNRKSAVKFFEFADYDTAIVSLSKNASDLISFTNNKHKQPIFTQISEKLTFPMISFFGFNKFIEKDSILTRELHNLGSYRLKITLKSFYNRSSFETYGESSPPMPFIIGPFALLDLGNRYKVSVQQNGKSVDLIEFENTFTWLDLEFHYKKKSQELNILVDGKQICKQESQILKVYNEKISLGCGFYKRYWKGEIKSIELSNLETGTIQHLIDLTNISALLKEVSNENQELT